MVGETQGHRVLAPPGVAQQPVEHGGRHPGRHRRATAQGVAPGAHIGFLQVGHRRPQAFVGTRPQPGEVGRQRLRSPAVGVVGQGAGGGRPIVVGRVGLPVGQIGSQGALFHADQVGEAPVVMLDDAGNPLPAIQRKVAHPSAVVGRTLGAYPHAQLALPHVLVVPDRHLDLERHLQ